ncbi:MAG: c-type cytochrome [bacterium]|nr:c-type cytochrome [bacterium]
MSQICRLGFFVVMGFIGAQLSAAAPTVVTDTDPLMIQLGRLIFFDTNLSMPNGQSCATCHRPEAAFTDPNGDPVSKGVLPRRRGNRNSPSVAYAAYSPPIHFDPTVRPGVMEGMYVGGLFWDGRADTLVDQAKAPFLNPLEMHNPNKVNVVNGIRRSRYARLFIRVFGIGAFLNTNRAYDCAAQAIAAYERSAEVCQFSSKYDDYLAGAAQLTEQEARGLALFTGTGMGGAKCVNCHAMQGGPDGRPLFTNFGYQNIGVPRNPENPFYDLSRSLNPAGRDYVDLGLGAILDDPKQNGKFKIPSLRNCARTAPYMHNGVFATLREVVHFDNTRDVANWPTPEVAANVHRHMPPMPGTFGQLGLTNQQEEDIVAFLHTLTDGYQTE